MGNLVEAKKGNLTEAKQVEVKVHKPDASVVKTLDEKMFHLSEILVNSEWTKDGVNAFQKYKYISEAEYKKHMGRACLDAGLTFNFEVIDSQIHTDALDKQILVTIKARVTYTDKDTGLYKVFLTEGHGADNGDKGLYKAMTGAYKFHIANNFHVNEDSDPENEPERKPRGNSHFVSKEGQAQAKKDLMTPELATAAQVKQLDTLLKEYVKIDPEKEKAFREANPDLTKIGTKSIVTIINNISKVIAAAKKEAK